MNSPGREPRIHNRRVASAADAAARIALAVMTPQQALRALDSSFEGLATEQVAARAHRYGANRIPTRHRRMLVSEFSSQFTHFFALTLWVSAALAFMGSMPQLGTAIIIVVVVNGLFSFAQEYRAERATRALAALLPALALVRRSGERRAIPATELVPGDVVILEEGAHVSADARVLSAAGLRVDNSALTGESQPVSRTAEHCRAPVEEVDARNLVFAGTWVVAGTATALVISTGGSTRIGRISELTRSVRRRPTPLHVSMNRAVRGIGVIALCAGLAFAVVAHAVGMPARNSLLFSVGVIVALVPEGLLPTLTLALAMSARRMARRGALVRHLEAVETLGSTTVICTDKTGTLTANQMTAVRCWTPTGDVRVTGTGYDPSGSIVDGDHPLSAVELGAFTQLLQAAALCGDARIERSEKGWRCIGDPTDGALVVLARKAGVERERAEASTPRLVAFPFEPVRRRMSTVHALDSGERLVLTKGATETVLPLCTRAWVRDHARPLAAEDRARVESELEGLARQGLRVIALARKTMASSTALTAEAVESDLELLGLVGMWDPVRPEIADAIAKCRAAGIRVLMVTGDHPSTASTIAQRINLQGTAIVGTQLPADDGALASVLAGSIGVIARVAPEQKLAIARALQARGEVVAMTGDGVNDAPALRQADIGVAMGACGTDVARDAADVVLLDDDFSHIVEAVEEGRAAFANIRRFLTYHLTDNVAELTPFVVWALSGGTFPLVLSVLQVLALDIGTDLLPALALGAEAPEPGVMLEPPRSQSVRLLDVRVLGRAFGFLGVVEAAISLSFVPIGASLYAGWGFGSALPAGGAALALLSTMVFASIVLMQAANAFECRSNPASLFARDPLSNRLLVVAVLVELGLLSAFVYQPALRTLLGHRPLTAPQWALLLAAPLALIVCEELRKFAVRVRARSGAESHLRNDSRRIVHRRSMSDAFRTRSDS